MGIEKIILWKFHWKVLGCVEVDPITFTLGQCRDLFFGDYSYVLGLIKLSHLISVILGKECMIYKFCSHTMRNRLRTSRMILQLLTFLGNSGCCIYWIENNILNEQGVRLFFQWKHFERSRCVCDLFCPFLLQLLVL